MSKTQPIPRARGTKGKGCIPRAAGQCGTVPKTPVGGEEGDLSHGPCGAARTMEEAQPLPEMPPKAEVTGRKTLAPLLLPPSRLSTACHWPDQAGGQGMQVKKGQRTSLRATGTDWYTLLNFLNHWEFLPQYQHGELVPSFP